MMIAAKMIAHSVGPQGIPIATMQVTFPRFILAEFNTHRMFSRNSASSRAIPFEKMVKMVQENPFVPIAWQKEHKGMQGTEYITDTPTIQGLQHMWLTARNEAMESAIFLSELEATKQLCNRLLEPFMWHTVLITSTEFENFFQLRCPQYHEVQGQETVFYRSKKDQIKALVGFPNIQEAVGNRTTVQWLQANKGQAEIHMMALAEAMWDCLNESTPVQLKEGEWHIPFGGQMDEPQLAELYKYRDLGYKGEEWCGSNFDTLYRVEIATARCARISYQLPGEEDKPANYANDIKLHDRLLASKHMSPFEHCARAMSETEYD